LADDREDFYALWHPEVFAVPGTLALPSEDSKKRLAGS
jgi:hypothetical protein